MKCELVDVFSSQKLSGNSLTIFSDCDYLTTSEMLAWTREMRQFESVFIQEKSGTFFARIFTMEEELDFAGHPLLGLTYHLHDTYGHDTFHEWVVHTNQQRVHLCSLKKADTFMASLQQGKPDFIRTLLDSESRPLYNALGLIPSGSVDVPAEVISTGLAYVILPVVSGLETVSFQVRNLTPLIEPFGAKFLYVLNIKTLEGRTWNNQGTSEDIATGSAAGPAAAFLYKHKLIKHKDVILQQGRFQNRPSQLNVHIDTDETGITNLHIHAAIVKVADIIPV